MGLAGETQQGPFSCATASLRVRGRWFVVACSDGSGFGGCLAAMGTLGPMEWSL